MNKVKDNEMYAISRIDDDARHTHAWRVSISRRRKRLVKNFPDKRLGGTEKALLEAKKYRDDLVILNPPISRKEFCDIKRKNNKSGITGVFKYGKPFKLKDGTIKKLWYWEANWPDENGNSISVAFSIKKFGEEGARCQAVDARRNGLNTVTGSFWASAAGDFNHR